MASTSEEEPRNSSTGNHAQVHKTLCTTTASNQSTREEAVDPTCFQQSKPGHDAFEEEQGFFNTTLSSILYLEPKKSTLGTNDKSSTNLAMDWIRQEVNFFFFFFFTEGSSREPQRQTAKSLCSKGFLQYTALTTGFFQLFTSENAHLASAISTLAQANCLNLPTPFLFPILNILQASRLQTESDCMNQEPVTLLSYQKSFKTRGMH